MTLTIPLSVRLSTAAGDRNVTAEVHDVEFRSVAPGGFASASIELSRPLTLQPPEIAYYGRLYIYDGRNGMVVWEGRVEDPGRGVGSDGQVWTINALGPSAHAQDRKVPYIMVDSQLQQWQPSMVGPKVSAVTSVTDDPGGGSTGNQVIVCRFPQSTTVALNDGAAMRYWPIQRAGQKLARYDYTWDAGFTNANWQEQAVTRTDGLGGGSAEVSRSDTVNVAGGGSSAKVAVTDFPNGRNTLDVRLLVSAAGGAGTTGSDTAWASFAGVVVLAMRYNAAGVELVSSGTPTGFGGYTTNSVLASDVVADLLGRLLPAYDGANASVATTAFAINQLAYPDGVTPQQVLLDLMALEPAYFWAAWESNAAGKYRFIWQQWPTTVRYETDVFDGIDSPGSADGLFNAVRVRYKDAAGAIQTVQRTSTVAVLTAAGLTRESFIDLSDNVGSATAANQAGDQFLVQHQTAPNVGSLTVAGPVQDLSTGRAVMPWEVRPGNLIRVRGILPRPDSLNATTRDGVTVFRVTAVTYRASSASARLELDDYPYTVSTALAKLSARDRVSTRRR